MCPPVPGCRWVADHLLVRVRKAAKPALPQALLKAANDAGVAYVFNLLSKEEYLVAGGDDRFGAPDFNMSRRGLTKYSTAQLRELTRVRRVPNARCALVLGNNGFREATVTLCFDSVKQDAAFVHESLPTTRLLVIQLCKRGLQTRRIRVHKSADKGHQLKARRRPHLLTPIDHQLSL